MPVLSGSYDVAMRLLRWAAPTVRAGSSKVAVGVRGRAEALPILTSWAGAHRDPSRPLVWMHAPSVGEGLQAKAILESLRERLPSLQSTFTFFSPSAEAFAGKLPVDVGSYLPWDVRSELGDLLRALRPDLIAFTKTEVWPGLTSAAEELGIPVILCAGTLSARAGRLRPGARQFLRPTFGALTRVLAIAEEDAERFLDLGVQSTRVEVTGDPGIDSAWVRARDADPDSSYLVPFVGDARPTLIAGSTWRADEALLVPALAKLAGRAGRAGDGLPGLRGIIAPHEPQPPHLDRLERMILDAGLSVIRLEEVEQRGEDGGAQVVIVDRVGVLAHLYTIGSIGYVGGGLGRAGLHSVLEPAAAGLPVLFGPRHRSSRAAGDLLALGGAVSVATAGDLERILRRWLDDDRLRAEIGSTAAGYIEQHRGAAERTARAMASLIDRS